MRIAFMGTPQFAVPSLCALERAGFAVVAAFTQPDRPSGRGHRMMPPPVKQAAIERGIPVFQFERLRRQQGIDALRSVKPDIVVTAAFGQILSNVLLAVPPMGTVNVHASLLPQYRGPAPINWCIINGETHTGVTTMYTDRGIDTGDMIYAQKVAIGERETAGELTERLAQVGAELIVRTMADIRAGIAPRTPQDGGRATHHPMLTKELGKVDWSRPAREIANLVRGVDPWPGAYTSLAGERLKIWSAAAAEGGGEPGELLAADPREGLVVACGSGALRVEVIQAPGKGRMDARDWLRGHPLNRAIRLGDEK